MLAGIWERTLGVDCVGVHDNFFELGGHSLMAIGLVATVGRELGVHLPLRVFFAFPTISGQVLFLRGEGDVGDGGGLPELEPAWGAAV